MNERQTEILIVGGGLGGVAGALSALTMGRQVILTEQSDWLGGQLTVQAVPPDEHPWIESTGCTASYRRLREEIRGYYRQYYPLLPQARNNVHLNPGQGYVSPLCHEPRVAVACIAAMLAPYRAGGQLDILYNHRSVEVENEGDRISAVTLLNEQTGEEVTIKADYVLDATELGDLLELGEIEHVIGAECQDQTGEPHAPNGQPDPLDQQAITWCFAIDHLPGQNHTIEKPADYDFWRGYQADFWPGPHLGWTDVNPRTLKPRYLALFDAEESLQAKQLDYWRYRRIFYRKHYPDGLYPSDICLVNWSQNDYWLGPLLGVSDEDRQKHLRKARQLSLSLLYWMQTEAPRPDGGQGYPGLRLRSDIVGSSDGLAKSVYVRESRRIQAEFTVLEQHIGVQARGDLVGAEEFPDSVGIGSYRIDLHPSTANRNYVDVSTWPFQIPLGALIPVRVENLLPAGKNLGVTHITNGCYRLHPIEWNIGEAAGALAAYCLEKGLVPRQVRSTPTYLVDFQRILTTVLGFTLAWPEYAKAIPR